MQQAGGVGARPTFLKQKTVGSNPDVNNPERGSIRALILCNLFWSTQLNDQETVFEG